ncbi:uncharacterized protein LOC123661381 [Melitaea cinxia]|uniref:uncharacterized protein LOC123661381 n=1 Tax=Melitaea cinxia TaxID=113334 RepID=UPI001E26FEAF|nr:uncharacterized protein LOC123661381 [Melitaea cinxia]
MELKPVRDELAVIRESMNFINSQYETIVKRLDDLEKNMKSSINTKSELGSIKDHIDSAEVDNDKREPWVRRSNVEIFGIPERKGENLMQILRDVASKAEFSLDLSQDIDFVTRVVPKNNACIYDQEIFDSRYTVYRCDRDYETRGVHLGGGVLIALRRELQVYSFSTVLMPGAAAEAIKLCVNLKSSNKSERLNIFCGHFPHCPRHFDSLLHFFESVSDVIVNNPDDGYFILGDFNISSAQWTSTDHAPYMTNSTINGDHLVQALQGFISFTDLRQYNHIFNTKNRILDLVFSKRECLVAHCKEPLIDEDPHHPALDVILKSSSPQVLHSARRVVRLFHNANYDAINNDIASVEWQILLQGKDVDAAVATFYDLINNIISKHVPIKIFRHDTRYPSWFSRSLVKIIKEKLKYHKKWKIYGRRCDYDTFSLLRDLQKRVMRECYDKFIIDAEKRIKINSKYFWTFIKSKKYSSDLPETMFFDDETSGEGNNICSLFNSYFHSVFEPPVWQSFIPDYSCKWYKYHWQNSFQD